MSSQEKAILTIFIGVIIGIAIPLLDRVFAESVLLGQGNVVQKEYVAANRASGSAYVTGGQNDPPIYMESSSSEKWIVLVKQGGDVFSAEVTPATWESLEDGSPVEVREVTGKFFSYGKSVRAYKE